MSATSYALQSEPMLLSRSVRDALVMTYVRSQDGRSVPLSYYGDPVWDYTPYFPHAARRKHDKQIQWTKTPAEWVESLKGAVAAFMHHKRPGGTRLDPATLPKRTVTLNAFAKWCSAAGIKRFKDVRGLDIARYLQKLHDDCIFDRTLACHISLLRRIHEMRMYMTDSLTDDAAAALRYDQIGALWEPGADEARRTELIPLPEAARLFGAAIAHLEMAPKLLQLRDELEADWHAASKRMTRKNWGDKVKRPHILDAGFANVLEFESAVADVRTAAYIVLAQTTGCRVHELGDIRVDCVYSEVVEGETYWWLKSATRKIGDGPERWLAPKVAAKAVEVLEWHSAPLRQRLGDELASARRELRRPMTESERGKLATRVLELERNAARLFLSESSIGISSTHTQSHNKQLRAFAQRRDFHFASPLSTHRFRRTYAVIVVHLNKGARIDLVTLQHHYKHASLLMTEWYAALPDTDKELYDLIDEETDYFDLALVAHWMEPSTPLAGGLGSRIKAYPGRYHQPMFFTSRREFIDSIRDGLNIRSTGHSWCLADAQDCGGRGLFEAARCINCANGVIDESFQGVWQNLRTQHAELIEMSDIGPGGREKARRCLTAADAVLEQLTHKTAEGENG